MPTGQVAAVNQRRVNDGRRGMLCTYHTLLCETQRPVMLGPVSKGLKQLGVRPWMMQTLSMGAIGLCIGLWIQAKTYDQEQRANGERRALFVGLWPPTIWLIGDSIARES
jgi:hypothetical protein